MAHSIRLWVYGTLKRGGRLHDAMKGATFLGEYRTVGGYLLVRLESYPGLIRHARGEMDSSVVGELYEVPEGLLENLDRIEGAPHLFRRESIDLEGLADPAEAYVYQCTVAGKPVVPNGVWPVS